MKTFCNHFFVEGFGCMGDAVVCIHCGLDKYPEAIPVSVGLARLQGRYATEKDPHYDSLVQQAIEARNKRSAGQTK